MMEGVRIWKDRYCKDTFVLYIQLYNLGVLYENMNTSIKYVLQAKVTMKSSKFIVTFKNDVHMGWIIFLRPVL